jgi:DnaJ-class molecular chaperone
MVVDTVLYDLLGVSPNVGERDLRKAFMQKAKALHPDKNQQDPDATAKFQAMNEAYAILKDPERRRVYDDSGLEGLTSADPDGDHLGDLFEQVFGFRNLPKKTARMIEALEVTLEELYTGVDKPLEIERDVICQSCQGNGTKSGAKAKECSRCDGEGVVLTHRVSKECPKCQGMGRAIPKANRCPQCKGKGSTSEGKTLTVHVEPGATDGDRITFTGQSNEAPEWETGDLVVILSEVSHDRFKHANQDLIFVQTVTLYEALFGVKFAIEHLDGRQLIVESAAVLTPKTVKIIKGEGMPAKGDPFHKGTLYISFNIEFPEAAKLTPELKAALAGATEVPNRMEGIDPGGDNSYPIAMEDGSLEEYENALKVADGKQDGDEEEEEEEEFDDEACASM